MRSIAEIEAEREARKEGLRARALEQQAIDLEALNTAEIEHGDGRVGALKITYQPGLPGMVVVRAPSKPELKRYRDRATPKKEGSIPDRVFAAEELAAVTRVYPAQDKDGNVVFDAMCEAVPGLAAQCGVKAVTLGTASEAEEGKG